MQGLIFMEEYDRYALSKIQGSKLLKFWPSLCQVIYQ